MIDIDKQVLNKATDEYITTRQAAKILGLSLGTVQQMAESGVLSAWKTSGGHRRVSLASVKEQLRRRSTHNSQTLAQSDVLSVLIAEDDPSLQKLYTMTMNNWALPVSLQIVSNGFEGLVQIGQQPPDILILDLMMPGMDGFEMIRNLRANPVLSSMDIIVVTGMSPDSVKDRGGLPKGTTLYSKPIPFAQLQGFLQAKLAQRQRGLAEASS
ncbi:MAG: response regulator [Betaproteobacteria bacterium]